MRCPFSKFVLFCITHISLCSVVFAMMLMPSNLGSQSLSLGWTFIKGLGIIEKLLSPMPLH